MISTSRYLAPLSRPLGVGDRHEDLAGDNRSSIEDLLDIPRGDQTADGAEPLQFLLPFDEDLQFRFAVGGFLFGLVVVLSKTNAVRLG